MSRLAPFTGLVLAFPYHARWVVRVVAFIETGDVGEVPPHELPHLRGRTPSR